MATARKLVALPEVQWALGAHLISLLLGTGAVPSRPTPPPPNTHPTPWLTHTRTQRRAAAVEVAGHGGSGASSGMPALPSVSAAGSNE